MLSFLGAAIILTLLPGPDNMYVVTESIVNGRTKGIAVAIGLSLGVIIHTLAAAFGLSIIIQESEQAFDMIKYIGAAYILYLAYGAHQNKSLPTLEKPASTELWQSLQIGFFMNVLNPKVTLFFLALLPQFLDQSKPNVRIQMIFLGAIFMIQAAVIMSGFAIAASFLHSYVRDERFWKYVRYAKVVVLIGFASLLLFAKT